MKIILSALLFLGAVTISFAQVTNLPATISEKPIVLGSSFKISSKILAENRVVNIYLPEGYNKSDTVKYPVVYLLDGGVEEDFIHIAGLLQYNTQPWIARFPKSILVGIENTNRKRDFSFPVSNLDFVERIGFKKEQFPAYGGSAKFIAFMENELQPLIQKNYRTTQKKTIIGESFAGLLATEILLKHTYLFDTYIIMSPSLWWDKESLLAEAPALIQANHQPNINVYIGACSKDEDKIMYDDVVSLKNVLEKYGTGRFHVFYDYLPNETHATIIHQAVYNAFKMLYPNTAY
jgi:predicted alpha/beta superfamily hydrolase